ncbi:MAG TPA: hypothetical protein VFI63_03350 [Solirubrobacterales bacterium]|nr:hypothetical protein [Solirubrobacterales bacterium]
MRESWTDERLDDFAKQVDRRFDEVERRFGEMDRKVDRRFDKVDHELHRINDRLDGMHRALMFALIAFTSATLAGYGSIIALVLTRT